MSEYDIPFHVQEEIMRRLPVKSLIRFRSVSKAWKSLIDSSQFITTHSLHRHTQQQHLLVLYEDQQRKKKYVCYIDDDTFPQHRSLPTFPPPLFAEQIVAVDSSHGLVCLSIYDDYRATEMTAVWNPSIRRYIVVAVPAKPDGVGFGVCPVTNDPKIVSITQSFWDAPETSNHCQFMVYTLSSGEWRSLSTNLPTKGMQLISCSVVTDGFIYWRAGSHIRNCIISFDVTNENVEVIDLPDTLAHHDLGYLHICKLKESLAILQSHTNTCTVWMMEHGVQRSFTKLFTIVTPHDYLVGFRKNGVPIMKVTEHDDDDDDDDDEPYKLVVYEPNSQHTNILEMSTFGSFYVNSYTETLLLLGQSDCISY